MSETNESVDSIALALLNDEIWRLKYVMQKYAKRNPDRDMENTLEFQKMMVRLEAYSYFASHLKNQGA